ncbi:hypothetical protein BC941DRAFT_408064 [Chlamydoabsidia padenii]|nr:hypothetical protein BC941DRAFT_408064 [Chlamydoabsidia padenii]
MTTSISSSSSLPALHTTSTSTRQATISTQRKVNHELARLKCLGKVTKKSDEDEENRITTTINSHQSDDDKMESSSQLDSTRHHPQLDDYRRQLVEQEKHIQTTIANYTEKIASTELTVHQLTLLVEKQDRLIQLLMDQRQQSNNDKATWHSLHSAKQELETAIGTLKANMETNQAHMQMMMMVSTEIQTDFERQKKAMQDQLNDMVNELATKDALLLQYQQQQPKKQQQTKPSYRPIANPAVLSPPLDTTSRYPSLISTSSSSSSSSTSSSISSSSSSSPVYTSTAPPPVPFKPPHGSPNHSLDQFSRSRAGSFDQPKPFWKAMKSKWRHS